MKFRDIRPLPKNPVSAVYKQILLYGEKIATLSQYFTHPRCGRGYKYRRKRNRIYPKVVRPEMGKKGKEGCQAITKRRPEGLLKESTHSDPLEPDRATQKDLIPHPEADPSA